MTCGFNSQSRLKMDTTREKTKGKANNTWRRTVERKLKELHVTWGEAESLANKSYVDLMLLLERSNFMNDLFFIPTKQSPHCVDRNHFGFTVSI